MLKLNISRIIHSPDPAYSGRIRDVASFELPDDPAVIAQVVSAIGDILVNHHNKPKPGGGVPVVGGGGSPSAPIPIDVTPSGGPGEPIQYVPVMGGGQTSFTQTVNKSIRRPAVGGGEFSR